MTNVIKQKKYMFAVLTILWVIGMTGICGAAEPESESYTYFYVETDQVYYLEPGQKANIYVRTDGSMDKVTFASSDESIAKVESDGTVSAVSGGKDGTANVAIHVFYDGKIRNSWNLLVKNTVTLNHEEYDMYLGQKNNSCHLKAVTNPQGNVEWSSSDTSVATVNQYGVVTPKKAGMAYIQAKANGVSAQCAFYVLTPSFGLDSSADVYVKNKTTLDVWTEPECIIKWKSLDTSIVKVDSKGVLTGVKEGKAVVTATVAGISKKCNITVKTPTISLYERDLHVYSGSLVNLYADIEPYNAAIKWESSNPKVATVDKNGVVKAVGIGKAKLYASIPGVKSRASCKITVYKNTYKLNQTSGRIMKGKKMELRVEKLSGKYLNYQCEAYNDTISIDDKGNGTCIIKGKKAGKETVVVSFYEYVDGNSILWRQKCNVTVVDKGISEQQLSRAVGQKKTLKLVGAGTSSSIQKITWESSDKKVAVVNPSTGAVTAKGKGTVKITATASYHNGSTKKYSATMKVSAPTIKKSSISLAVYKTFNLGLKGTNAWSTISYKSNKPSVATVDKNGIVTAVAKGNATITISVDGKVMKCKVYVSNPGLVSYHTILAPGDTAHIKFTGVGSKSKISYKNKNSSVAKVNSKGIVTAKAYGSANIDIVVDGVKFTYLVEVAPKRAIDACNMGEYILKNWTYSQDKRMTEGYYDCSGLVFRAYGFDSELLGGSPSWGPTAANMAKHMEETGKVLAYGVISPDKMRPGDLIFQGETDNGRFLGIYHVDLYYGGGYYAPYNTVMIARPLQ